MFPRADLLGGMSIGSRLCPGCSHFAAQGDREALTQKDDEEIASASKRQPVRLLDLLAAGKGPSNKSIFI